MKNKENRTRNIFRILGTIALAFYIAFLIGESTTLSNRITFADISVYLLFAVFIVAYYFLWKNELISGIMILAWYALELILVFWVWVDGGLTLILGFPIVVLGVFLVIYGNREKSEESAA